MIGKILMLAATVVPSRAERTVPQYDPPRPSAFAIPTPPVPTIDAPTWMVALSKKDTSGAKRTVPQPSWNDPPRPSAFPMPTPVPTIDAPTGTVALFGLSRN